MIRDNDNNCVNFCSHISWSAIIVGALVGTGLGFLLNLFGMAIGLSAFHYLENGTANFAIGGFLGLVIAVIAAMLVAGYTSGYLGREYCVKGNLGIVYGFATWTLTLILTAALAGSVSNYLANYANTTANQMVIDKENSHFVMPHFMTSESKTDINAKPNAANAGENVKANEAAKVKAAATMPLDAKKAACLAFVVFALFIIGAISTCVGAVMGMHRRK